MSNLSERLLLTLSVACRLSMKFIHTMDLLFVLPERLLCSHLAPMMKRLWDIWVCGEGETKADRISCRSLVASLVSPSNKALGSVLASVVKVHGVRETMRLQVDTGRAFVTPRPVYTMLLNNSWRQLYDLIQATADRYVCIGFSSPNCATCVAIFH